MPRRRGQQRPEAHLRIELGLELLKLGLVELGSGCHAVPQRCRKHNPLCRINQQTGKVLWR